MGNMFKFIEERTYNPLGGGPCIYHCYDGACWAEILKELRKYKKYAPGPIELVEDVTKKQFPPDEIWFLVTMLDWLSPTVSNDIILQLFEMMNNNPRTRFLTSTKNPQRIHTLLDLGVKIPSNIILGCTIESDINYYDLSKAMPQTERLFWMYKLRQLTTYDLFIAVEPVLYFTLKEFLGQLLLINPWKVAVGYNNYPHIKKLPEPTLNLTLELIEQLEVHGIEVERKKLRDAIPCVYNGQQYPLQEVKSITLDTWIKT